MDYNKNTTNSKKNKHLTFQKRCFIEIRLKDKWSAYKIAKVINRPINTILNEIRSGTVRQINLVIEFILKIDKILKVNTRS